MTTINIIQDVDYVSDSREIINDNFESLNTNKQEIESGKGLSTNDFITAYKDKLVDLAPNYSLTPDLVDDIQDTLDEIALNGGGILYLLPGTYTLTSNINIPSGVELSGTSRDNCIIECVDYSINMKGGDTYSIGTVSISNGDTTLIGDGTTFVNTMVDSSIWLDGYWYLITAFTSTTELEIEEYGGVDLTNSDYVIADINTNSIVSNLTIQNSSGVGILCEYSREPILNDVNISGCATGIDMNYVLFPSLLCSSYSNGINLDMNFVEGYKIDFSEFSFSTTGAGVVMTNTRNAIIINSSITYNTGEGITLTNCSKLPFIACDISYNGTSGIEFISDCYDNQINNTICSHNGTNGIKLTATSDRNILNSLTVTDNGTFGITISNGNCDNNILLGVIASGNVSGSLSDSGTGTLKNAAVNILP